MSIAQESSPGTVSKILWHFTGGPLWNAKMQKQGTKPKSAALAFKNLQAILKAKELKLGSYKEVVKVLLPAYRQLDLLEQKVQVKKNIQVPLESSPVCCLTDIPSQHLKYHSHRYGKFAIGFHREAVIQAGFNPVLYTLEDTPIVRSIYQGLSGLAMADPDVFKEATANIEGQIDEDYPELNVSSEIWEIEEGADLIEAAIDGANESIQDLMAFVKTFEPSQFGTIYCEREWRSTQAYSFEIDDVAMVVLPKKVSSTKYFRPFVERTVQKLRLPRRIPVVPWEDLVEH